VKTINKKLRQKDLPRPVLLLGMFILLLSVTVSCANRKNMVNGLDQTNGDKADLPDVKGLPKTLDEAVEYLYKQLDEKTKLEIANTEYGIMHFGYGMYVRNELGLWRGNRELLSNVAGSPLAQPDYVGSTIAEALKEKIRREYKKKEREKGQSKLLGGKGILNFHEEDDSYRRKEPLKECDAQMVDSLFVEDLVHLRFALEHGANPLLKNLDGVSVLEESTWDKDVDVVKLLSMYVKPKFDIEKVICLSANQLEKHPIKNVNATDVFGYTVLMYACQLKDKDKIELLLENGADPSMESVSGIDALYLAIKQQQVDIVEDLLEEGSSIQKMYFGKLSPLMLAAFIGNTGIVESLIKAGAKQDHTLSCIGDDLASETPFKESERYRDLDDNLADLFFIKCDRWYALHLAVRYGSKELIALLATQHPEGVFTETGDGQNLVDIAAHYARKDLVKDLLAQGVPGDSTDYEGFNALHQLACCNDYKKSTEMIAIARLLVDAGTDPSAGNGYGESPLELARRLFHEKLADYLAMSGTETRRDPNLETWKPKNCLELISKIDLHTAHIEWNDAILFLRSFSVKVCKECAECSEYGNEVLFDFMEKRPRLFFSALFSLNKAEQLTVKAQLEHPVHDGINIIRRYDAVKNDSTLDPVLKEKALAFLKIAVENEKGMIQQWEKINGQKWEYPETD